MPEDLEYYLNHGHCVTIPDNTNNIYLNKREYLSEFNTNDEKQQVLNNLGITEKLDALKTLINGKILSLGGVVWDLIPTEGNTDHALSSDALYKILKLYAAKEDVDIIYNNFYTQVDTLKDYVEQAYWHVYNKIEQDLINPLIAKLEELKEYYISQVEELKLKLNSITSSGTTVLSSRFGTSETIGISQKTLTEAINKINNRLSDLTGEPIPVIITISPDYIITNKKADINVNVKAGSNIYDYVKVRVNGEERINRDGVISFNETISINETSTIFVEVSYLGEIFTKELTITRYEPFFIGGGLILDDILVSENQKGDSVIGKFKISLNEGDKIIILVPSEAEIGQITMSGYNIPFDVTEEEDYTVYISQNTYQQGTYELRIR